MSKPLILGVDTSGPYCSAALFQGGDVLSDVYEDMSKGQAEALFPLLEDLMVRGGACWGRSVRHRCRNGAGELHRYPHCGLGDAWSGAGVGGAVIGVTLLEALVHATSGPVIVSIAAPRGQAFVQGVRMAREVEPALMSVEDLPLDLVEPGLSSIGSAGAEIARGWAWRMYLRPMRRGPPLRALRRCVGATQLCLRSRFTCDPRTRLRRGMRRRCFWSDCATTDGADPCAGL